MVPISKPKCGEFTTSNKHVLIGIEHLEGLMKTYTDVYLTRSMSIASSNTHKWFVLCATSNYGSTFHVCQLAIQRLGL